MVPFPDPRDQNISEPLRVFGSFWGTRHPNGLLVGRRGGGVSLRLLQRLLSWPSAASLQLRRTRGDRQHGVEFRSHWQRRRELV